MFNKLRCMASPMNGFNTNDSTNFGTSNDHIHSLYPSQSCGLRYGPLGGEESHQHA